jgi:hypothetical protein
VGWTDRGSGRGNGGRPGAGPRRRRSERDRRQRALLDRLGELPGSLDAADQVHGDAEPGAELLSFDGLGTHSATCIDVAALAEQIELLKARVEQLEGEVDALQNHTHTYLTGNGIGHNNTTATTGPPETVE